MTRWSTSTLLSSLLLIGCGGSTPAPEASKTNKAAQANAPAANKAGAAAPSDAPAAAKPSKSTADAAWSKGKAVTPNDLVSMCSVKLEVMADAAGNAPTEGYAADGSLEFTSASGAMEEHIKGKWALAGDTLKIAAKRQVINGNGDAIVDEDASAKYSDFKRYGDVLVGKSKGKWYATKDCGAANWQESTKLTWDQSVVQVIDATGGASQVNAAVTALTGAGAVVIPGKAANTPRQGAEILTRSKGDYSSLKAALEQSGFSPVAMKVWADSPAPVVVAVGPNRSK